MGSEVPVPRLRRHLFAVKGPSRMRLCNAKQVDKKLMIVAWCGLQRILAHRERMMDTFHFGNALFERRNHILRGLAAAARQVKASVERIETITDVHLWCLCGLRCACEEDIITHFECLCFKQSK